MEKLKIMIMEICTDQYFKSTEIARILSKHEDYLKRKFLKPMIESGALEYQYPEMPNHPHQVYTKSKNEIKIIFHFDEFMQIGNGLLK